MATVTFEEMTAPMLRSIVGKVVSGVMASTDPTETEKVTFVGTVLGVQIADGARRVGIDMTGSTDDGNIVSWDRDQYVVTLSWDE